MVYVEQFVGFVKGLLRELEANGGGHTDPAPVGGRPPISRVRFRLLRAQYNKKLFPDKYTEANPDGLYSGKALAPGPDGVVTLNRESNAWLDLTFYDQNGLEYRRDRIRQLGLGYSTLFTVGDGFIEGGGQQADGTPEEWRAANPTGANLSQEAWRTSLGFTLRVHFAEEGEYPCEGSVLDHAGDGFTIRVS